MFEWKWDDVAAECEQHLGPKGFAAVQVSPPQKSISGGQWWTRYQPVSYAIEGRSGNESQFRSMVQRCAAVGVDIYVDAVINHMAAWDRYFPEVPYGPNDFNNCTDDINYGDRWSIQNCDLVGLNDLNTASGYVQDKIAGYMNHLIDLGVKGFRIDAAKHIPSGDISAILSRLRKDVVIFQEVIGAPGEPVQPQEYLGNGLVTEFNFERTIGDAFKGRQPIKNLRNITNWGWLNSSSAVVFVSNHDDQRHNADRTLTYKDVGDLYYIGEIFMLAYPYGYPKVMSSYYFNDFDQGPPSSGPHTGDACNQGWVCEHRWRGIANMVGFRNATVDRWEITDWWDNGNNQIAFGRGGLGFVAINREDYNNLNQTLQTGMPAGEYCDIINGEYVNGNCDGPIIRVNGDGTAYFNVDTISASAIHVNAKIGGGCSGDCPPPPPVTKTWENAYLRATSNSWGTTPMTFDEGEWTVTTTFGSGDGNGGPRFKISRFEDWSEAYPAEDYPITDGAGTYTITFNDQTKNISVRKGGVTPPPPSSGTVDVNFSCANGQTTPGQSVYVIGDITELGNWSLGQAVKLEPMSYPTWTGTVALPQNASVEWKCLKRSETNPNDRVEWQSGSNNSLSTGSSSQTSANASF
ncbi:hypothetical protein GCM10007877_16980 [Marinibactrum halimedae]|uniref:Alpha-amylase n=1 Tax=Marinibactrum halimedae TaxID=1444977 RepID=A0AA37WLT5_9GAMM|nr:hypothetical protein GCM10007877_16980 [Marinibactrum halimedae]